MSIDTDRKEIQKSIEDAKKAVDLGKALERLQSNKDFKLVITEGYFKEEAIRCVHRLSYPDMQNPHSQAAIQSAIAAIGNLSAHFVSVLAEANRAQKLVKDGEEELEAIALEEQAQ